MNISLKGFVGAVFILVFIVLYDALFIVNEAQQALVLQFGKVITDKPLYSGLNLKLPFVQNVIYFDKRILNLSSESREIIAGDQKRLIVDSYAKYRIIDPILFYQTVRSEEIMKTRLLPIAESNLRENIGKVSLYDFLNEYRSISMDNIQSGMQEDVTKFGIELIDFRIKKADLPDENSNAVFLRMQTEREKEAREIRAYGFEESKKIKSTADRDKRVLLSEAKQEAQTIRGQGDAESVRIFNEVLNSKKAFEFFDFYRSMQMYKDVFSDNKDKTSMILSLDNDLFKYFEREK